MAQDADRIELKSGVGTTGFVDSPTNYHFAIGGAVRLPLFRELKAQIQGCMAALGAASSVYLTIRENRDDVRVG